jgi:branched-chain amino acid aminotransferase
MHRFLLHNDDVQDASRKSASAGQVGLLNGWGVFTTIRVSSGVLFAWERHWARMTRDARKLRVPFPESPDWMTTRLHKLIEANRACDATLRIAVIRNQGGMFEGPGQTREFDLFAFTADLTHWPQTAALGLKPDARHACSEFAGTKVTSWAFNLNWLEEAHERGFDEVILLNERGEVSECTSANIFAVFGSNVVTPPLDSGCLPGITREILLEDIRVPGLTFFEKTLRPGDLSAADSIFITSSTRDVMPVRSVEGLSISWQASAAAARIGAAFREYRTKYVNEMAAANQ